MGIGQSLAVSFSNREPRPPSHFKSVYMQGIKRLLSRTIGTYNRSEILSVCGMLSSPLFATYDISSLALAIDDMIGLAY